jgi:hypothetical protein
MTLVGGGSYALWEARGDGKAESLRVEVPVSGNEDYSRPSGDGPAFERIASLERRLRALDHEVALLRVEMAAARSDSDAKAQPEPSSEPARRDPERHKAEWHSHIAAVEAAFRTETVDSSWASGTERYIEEVFGSQQLLAGTASAIQCHSRTCRVAIPVKGTQEFSAELPPILMKFADRLPSVQMDHVDDGNGERTLVMYMSRDMDK